MRLHNRFFMNEKFCHQCIDCLVAWLHDCMAFAQAFDKCQKDAILFLSARRVPLRGTGHGHEERLFYLLNFYLFTEHWARARNTIFSFFAIEHLSDTPIICGYGQKINQP